MNSIVKSRFEQLVLDLIPRHEFLMHQSIGGKTKSRLIPKLRNFARIHYDVFCFLHVVFGDETVVVEESWQPRRGAHSRAPPADLSENESVNNNIDEREDPTQNNFLHPGDEWFEQVPIEFSPNLNETDPSLALQPSSSMHTQVKNVTRKRKRKSNPVDSTLDRIASTMEERNDILEHTSSYKSKESTNSTEECMALVVKYVRAVPDLVPMTELYWASLDLIATNDVVQGLFLALPDAEMLPFLKRQNKESRNDFFDA
ncbi:unnamed protein product [Thlaspi arvense]|uniref:Uncharacterized protein n=1 Tax=Thlaspi arvense TaxID=13288 RepID=A0AAU9RT46_THLAR|nr:unnamed protein product [Thlaspi arvense]